MYLAGGLRLTKMLSWLGGVEARDKEKELRKNPQLSKYNYGVIKVTF